jgi:hypothetical protein
MVRSANGRDAVLCGTTARLADLKWYTSDEGRTYRQAFELKLVRDNLALFLLTWKLMHEINETSRPRASYSIVYLRFRASKKSPNPKSTH